MTDIDVRQRPSLDYNGKGPQRNINRESVGLGGVGNFGDVFPAAADDSWNNDKSGGKIDWLGLVADEQFKWHLKHGEHIKVYRKTKGFKQFRRLMLAQELRAPSESVNSTSSSSGKTSVSSHSAGNAVWCVKFSVDGKFMATAGKDEVLTIWKVISSAAERMELSGNPTSILNSTKNAISQLNGQLAQYGIDVDNSSLHSNSSITQVDSLPRVSMSRNPSQNHQQNNSQHRASHGLDEVYFGVFHPTPYASFHEHTDDILDLDWSKNSFILTGSMDKTCKLWNLERSASLKTFQHPDFVTGVRFLPHDDRFFVSACLDQKCRLWSIIDSEVAFEHDCGDLITAIDVSYTGKYTILGTLNGYIHVLLTKFLQPLFSFNVLDTYGELHEDSLKKSDSVTDGKGKNKNKSEKRAKLKQGPKITGIEFFQSAGHYFASTPKEMVDWFLVSSNDSRIRVYTLNKELMSVMKGLSNEHSQISAHCIVTKNGKAYVMSGSEDHWLYCWKLSQGNFSESQQEDGVYEKEKPRSRSGSLRGFYRRHNHNHDNSVADALESKFCGNYSKHHQPSANTNYIGFNAHHHPITCATAVPPKTAKVLSLSNDLICELTMRFWETQEDIVAEHVRKKPASKKGRTSGTFQRKDQANFSRDGLLSRNNSVNSAAEVANGVGDSDVNQPSMTDFIGGIMVSADTTGLIRVFRSDMSSNVRQRVLKKLEEIEKQLHDANISVQSRADITGTNSYPTVVSSISGNTYINNSGNNIGDLSELQAGSLMQESLLRHNESGGSLSKQQQQQLQNQTRVCNVCGGTRFIAKKSKSFNTISPSTKYYCADCGALYTSFR